MLRRCVFSRGLTLLGVALLLLPTAACRRRAAPSGAGQVEPMDPAAAKDPAVRAALAIIAEARADKGMAPGRLYLTLMDDLRQVEVARAAQRQKATPEQIAEAFAGGRPDPTMPPAERARRYATQASARLQKMLGGTCRARREDLGGQLRVGALTAPLPSSPPGSEAVLERLRKGLQTAKMVAVTCERGSLGMLLVVPEEAAGKAAEPPYLIVDMVPTGTGSKAAPVPVPGAGNPGKGA